MDDLDRLYFEFVEIARRERGAALGEPLTVFELHDERIPYRRVRDPAHHVLGTFRASHQERLAEIAVKATPDRCAMMVHSYLSGRHTGIT